MSSVLLGSKLFFCLAGENPASSCRVFIAVRNMAILTNDPERKALSIAFWKQTRSDDLLRCLKNRWKVKNKKMTGIPELKQHTRSFHSSQIFGTNADLAHISLGSDSQHASKSFQPRGHLSLMFPRTHRPLCQNTGAAMVA